MSVLSFVRDEFIEHYDTPLDSVISFPDVAGAWKFKIALPHAANILKPYSRIASRAVGRERFRHFRQGIEIWGTRKFQVQ